jgi:hypothetical protein
VAVLTLALGIGANTAIFSTVNGVLPSAAVPESQNLVTFWGTAPEKRLPVVNYPTGCSSFSSNGAGSSNRSRRTPPAASACRATVNRSGSRTPGVPGFLHRDAPDSDRRAGVVTRMVPREDQRGGAEPRALAAAVRWRSQSRWPIDPGGGQPTVVVGIMPPGFDFPERSEMWLPMVIKAEKVEDWYLSTVGRLKPGGRGRRTPGRGRHERRVSS